MLWCQTACCVFTDTLWWHKSNSACCAEDIHGMNMCDCVKRGISMSPNIRGNGRTLTNSQSWTTYQFSQPRSPQWWGCTGLCPGPSENGKPHLPKHSWKTKKEEGKKKKVRTLHVTNMKLSPAYRNHTYVYFPGYFGSNKTTKQNNQKNAMSYCAKPRSIFPNQQHVALLKMRSHLQDSNFI